MTVPTDVPSLAERHFLGHPAGQLAFTQALEHARQVVLKELACLPAVYSGAAPQDLARTFDALDMLPVQGRALADVLDWTGAQILRHSVAVGHPRTMAHLHCPPLVPALAAEAMLSAANQSMDSWDQAPAATHLEESLVRWMARLLSMPSSADGVFTSGGTQSNFMALLIARNLHAQRREGWDTQQRGLSPQAPSYRILCSEVAHFSVKKSAAILGLGHDAVVTVACDGQFRMRPDALERALQALQAQGHTPIAVVATAGTTDFGSVDPLAAIARICRERGVWLHVDAAYGGALALSGRDAGLLEGIALADSVTIDFHKLFFQPISCSMLLVGDAAAWETIRFHADYLNPEEHLEEGVPDLVTKSIQTTRRFDGLKVFVSLQVLGRDGYAALIDRCLSLARAAGGLIADDPELELACEPMIASVVFRYRPPGLAPALADHANRVARRKLLQTGEALIGFTKVNERAFVKFTLMNPLTSLADVRAILAAFKREACAAVEEAGTHAGTASAGS